MSVRLTQYLMFGAMLPYPKHLADDAFDRLIDEYGSSYFDKSKREGVTVLLDAMGGAWMAVGIVTERSFDGMDSIPTTTIPQRPSWVEMMKIDAVIREYDLNQQAPLPELRWHIISHYT